MLRYLFCLFLMMLLAGCATRGHFPVVKDPKTAFVTHRAAVLPIKQWTLRGSMGIKYEKHGQNAQFNWQQIGKQFKIELYGPLGIGATYLNFNGENAVLVTHDKKRFHAKSPEELMQEVLGWSVPVEGLVYWARGIADPQYPAQREFNQYGFLKSLHQSGWTIEYLDYQRVGKQALPKKMILTRPDVRIVAVLSHWGLK